MTVRPSEAGRFLFPARSRTSLRGRQPCRLSLRVELRSIAPRGPPRAASVSGSHPVLRLAKCRISDTPIRGDSGQILSTGWPPSHITGKLASRLFQIILPAFNVGDDPRGCDYGLGPNLLDRVSTQPAATHLRQSQRRRGTRSRLNQSLMVQP